MLLEAVAVSFTDVSFDGTSESSLALLSLKMLFILDLSTTLDVGVDVTTVAFVVTTSLLTFEDVTAASFDGWTIGLDIDVVDGDDCEAGESDANAAASVAARFACLAFAASLGSEKSPKSESRTK